MATFFSGALPPNPRRVSNVTCDSVKHVACPIASRGICGLSAVCLARAHCDPRLRGPGTAVLLRVVDSEGAAAGARRAEEFLAAWRVSAASGACADVGGGEVGEGLTPFEVKRRATVA